MGSITIKETMMKNGLHTFLIIGLFLLIPAVVAAKSYDAQGSRDYPRAPRMQNFYIGRYDETKFDYEEFKTRNGSIRIEGRKFVIDYYLQTEAPSPGKPRILQNYLDLFKAAGAELQLKGPYYYIFKLTKNGSETWIKVNPGNYDGKRYELTIVEKAGMVQDVSTGLSQMTASVEKDIEGSHDHTLVSRMPDFYIGNYEKNQSGFEKFQTKDGMVRIEGRKFVIDYLIQPKVIPPGKIQILRNYFNALNKIGAELLHKGTYYYVFKMNKNGTETWIKVDPGNYNGKRYTLTFIENEESPAGDQHRRKNQDIIRTNIFQMTGLSAEKRIVKTPILQMSGLGTEQRIFRTTILQMSGLSDEQLIIRTPSLQMTGLD